MKSGDNREMVAGHAEEALRFTPLLKGSDALPKRIWRGRFSFKKSALYAHDFLVISLALGVGIWASGRGFFLRENLRGFGPLLVLLLILIAFFPTFHLYSYHLIFSRKRHLANLSKSFTWSILSLGIISFLLGFPQYVQKKEVLLLLLFASIGLLLLSRYLGDYLLIFIKAVGVSFLAVGLIALLNGYEEPIFFSNWLAFLIGLCVAMGILLLSRVFLVQVVFNNWMRRRFRRQVAVVGSDEEAKRIASHIIDLNAPFWVAGIVGSKEVSHLEASVPKGWLGELRDLPGIVRRMKIREVIVTDEAIDKRVLISLLDYCTSEGVSVWFPPKLMPVIDTRLYIDTFCGLPMIRLCSQRNGWIFNKIKHALDALIAVPLFFFLLPIIVAIAFAIKITSRGPALYKASAVGKNGRIFKMYKFRSMRVEDGYDIHKGYVTKLIKGEISHAGDGDQPFKITEDPRITLMGRILRRYSIDELPQIINVLKGDMSLIGPRPCLPYEYEIYQDWHRKRLSIRPGISGLWQVAGRSAVTFEDMVLLDLYYIYNRNLLMDIGIIYETIFVVLGKRGAY